MLAAWVLDGTSPHVTLMGDQDITTRGLVRQRSTQTNGVHVCRAADETHRDQTPGVTTLSMRQLGVLITRKRHCWSPMAETSRLLLVQGTTKERFGFWTKEISMTRPTHPRAAESKAPLQDSDKALHQKVDLHWLETPWLFFQYRRFMSSCPRATGILWWLRHARLGGLRNISDPIIYLQIGMNCLKVS